MFAVIFAVVKVTFSYYPTELLLVINFVFNFEHEKPVAANA